MIGRGRIRLRNANVSEAAKLYSLITANLAEGHLLPRTLVELTTNAARFVVAMRGRSMVGCAELAPLGPHVAEVRSLVVAGAARQSGVGRMLLAEVRQRARREGFDQLCAFTHVPGYFIQKGFSIVPHLWVPEKIAADCVTCPQFQRCGRSAMVLPLDAGATESAGYGSAVSDTVVPVTFSRHA